MERTSAVLMPMTSLPSPYGVGTMGRAAFEFVDFLAASGQKYWQLLPLGPTSYGDSPYSSFSSFAGNPYYIDLDLLAEEGLLTKKEIEAVPWGDDPERTDYGRLYEGRYPLLRKAYERGAERLRPEAERFYRENGRWLSEYALYMAVKAYFGMKSWTEWPDDGIRKHQEASVREYTEKLQKEIDFHRFVQFLFYRQWAALKAYAEEKKVGFIGDVPIYVAMDSADVWSEPQFFQLDAEGRPSEVAGVPPDAFNDDGQLWGNPLYDWDRMKADGYGWWIRRIEGATKLFDVLRIDHFRGMDSYWAVPAGEKTAKNGRWRTGPGMSLVGVLTSWFHGTQFIAEDLGYLTASVRQLVKDSGLPGMCVMEFAFDAHGDSDYLPHRCSENRVCYLGTHDNDTVHGWLETTAESDLEFARRYMHITEDEGWCWGMIRTGMATASQLFVVLMQDLLELDGSARMNTPGTDSGNWQWRMKPGSLSSELAAKLRLYTETFRRCEVRDEEEETETEVKEASPAEAEKEN
ncbi:MAG: 4-alpha-glucanotransferase [Oscillospiraceae bacterium]|nr:4-alpha-glucanotransferase [Oscillospiraceae bacterium]